AGDDRQAHRQCCLRSAELQRLCWSWAEAFTYPLAPPHLCRKLAAYHLDLSENELSAMPHGRDIDWGDRGREIERHDDDRLKAYWGIAARIRRQLGVALWRSASIPCMTLRPISSESATIL